MLFSVTIRFFVDKPHQAALANSVAAQLEEMQQQYSGLFNKTLLGISWLSLRGVVLREAAYFQDELYSLHSLLCFPLSQGSVETRSTTVGPLKFVGACEATGGSST